MYLPFPWETAKSTRTECTSYNNNNNNNKINERFNWDVVCEKEKGVG